MDRYRTIMSNLSQEIQENHRKTNEKWELKRVELRRLNG